MAKRKEDVKVGRALNEYQGEEKYEAIIQRSQGSWHFHGIFMITLRFQLNMG